jgi:hypothetical protein
MISKKMKLPVNKVLVTKLHFNKQTPHNNVPVRTTLIVFLLLLLDYFRPCEQSSSWKQRHLQRQRQLQQEEQQTSQQAREQAQE